MPEVVVYSRKGCHLCDVVKETLSKVQGDADFKWHAVDIDSDPQLRQKYNDEVPVVFIDGRKAFKYHMDGAQFLRVLAGRTSTIYLRVNVHPIATTKPMKQFLTTDELPASLQERPYFVVPKR